MLLVYGAMGEFSVHVNSKSMLVSLLKKYIRGSVVNVATALSIVTEPQDIS